MFKKLFAKFIKNSNVDELLTVEDIEELLIRADFGPQLAAELISKLGAKHRSYTLTEVEVELKKIIKTIFADLPQLAIASDTLNIFLVVGVNGVGKTTSVGKLAYKFKQQGHKVLIAAADTFRAAAEAQLSIWAERAGVDIVQLEDGAKPSTVVYKAIEQVKNSNVDLLLIDTAGRLHNKQDLMDELSKIKSVIEKNHSDYRLHVLLVLDASTGQNAIIQAQKFKEVVNVNSVLLSKYDGSSKAGVICSLAYSEALPVSFVGTGEQLEDVEEFSLEDFVAKVFG